APPLGDQRLVGVEVRIQLGGAGRDHADDRAQYFGVVAHRAHVPDLGDKPPGRVVGEDRGEVLAYLVTLRDTAVEPDHRGVVGERLGEVDGAAPVPRLD